VPCKSLFFYTHTHTHIYRKPKCNKFHQEIGNIFCYIDEAIENWYKNSPKVQSGNYICSGKVVILVHIMLSVFVMLTMDYKENRERERKRVNSSVLAIIRDYPMSKNITELFYFVDDYRKIIDKDGPNLCVCMCVCVCVCVCVYIYIYIHTQIRA
jgi:ABC-type xylose transport system permease subunit